MTPSTSLARWRALRSAEWGVVLAALLVLLFAPPAGAAEELTLRKIDAGAFPAVKVSALYTGPQPDVSDVTVRENGRLVSDIDVVPISETTTPVGVVLVIDTSGSL